MGKGVIAVIVIVVLLVFALVLFGQYVSVKNTLVAKNEAVKSAWSQVDIVLQRRADLIPNLVETVKGYAKQEQTVFGDIAKARSQLLSAGTPQEKIAANQQLDGALGRLLLIVENYPQLKSFCAYRTNSLAPRIALPSSASATTTRCRTTTPTCSSSPTAFLPHGPDSGRIQRTSQRQKERGKFPR
jgi:hypothetical protein